ncbi:GNAT family N-acetyltransferase [Ideonella azotifigens]|uniref:N-acetyltransferase domain-containing protein n=1 Tax=Ideonella azotifigens TaxID=513160 RepID=A0ABN1JRX1_9BURK|nr:GNAT family N-acetyltransferase [Ideonella azotifigens]MCD2340849.1 GNAT family N-acetyltransferase [Ideonella azotifigens]
MPNVQTEVTVSSLATPADALAFRNINEAWISRLFSLTEEDQRVLGDPQGRILAHGGDVLLARLGDGEVVGCVALLSLGGSIFEMAKMGVVPEAQGAGIGRRLVDAAIARAAELGGTRLFLGTNSRLQPAIHLYEAAGFERITRDELPVADYYARADVLMRRSLV